MMSEYIGPYTGPDEDELARQADDRAYLAELAAAEDADPNFCEVSRDWAGHSYGYRLWCSKHQQDADHTTISGRVVCDAYASVDPGCDPNECCQREIEE